MKTETREVTPFDSIELRAFGTMSITQGEKESLTLEGDETLQKITSRVEGNTLILELGQNWLERIVAGIGALGRKTVKYHLTVKDLKSLKIMGSGDVHVPSLKTTHLHLVITGAGDIKVPALTADTLDVDISGRSEIDVAGQVRTQDIRIAGSGEYDAKNLVGQSANVSISSHGEVNYRGNPQVKQSIVGAGSVKRVGVQEQSVQV